MERNGCILPSVDGFILETHDARVNRQTAKCRKNRVTIPGSVLGLVFRRY